MPYPAKAVANYILDLADSDGDQITPMKLIKLVYLAHGWHLAIANEPLISEFPEAWKYGPVVPSLYHEFKTFGSAPITRRASRLKGSATKSSRLVPYKLPSDVPPKTLSIINAVWDAYKSLSAIQLSAMTHQPDTPWDRVFHANPERRGADMRDEDIKPHFVKLLPKNGGGD